MTRHVILPYVGVGDLGFGMSDQQVQAIIGRPYFARRGKYVHKETYARDLNTPFMSCVYDGPPTALRLVSLGFLPSAQEVFYEDINLFEIDRAAALGRLIEYDPGVMEALGFLVFPNLGIALTGFHDHAEKSVSAFARGQWDQHATKMKPFPLMRARV